MRRKAYARRKAEHACVKCGEQDYGTLHGRAYCAVCAEQENQRIKERQHRDLADGLCVWCRKPNDRAADGMWLCSKCAEKQSKSGQRCYTKKKAAGLCTRCGVPLPKGCRYTMCMECREERKTYREYLYWTRKNQGCGE